ncbi:phenylalanine--tRNA ligase subunit beta [Desulfogranum japonicum]|uniref:phenylalanine--tRNA ligase subunit beta n=1 Tax=Desulfogranum japonicum TaxID=231447 RepID=UPI000405AB83|nr:phenylalanine--tRNA ligase subunit beta [Desulfogranum japonicum]
MKFTLSWLSNFVSLEGIDAQLLADKLTMLGLEVDAVEELFTDLDHVICARIEKVTKHPNADKLTICEVNTGSGDTLQIICGAPNVREGMISALALPGTVLPGGVKIKKSKVRGEVSHGMLCSSRELGLSEEHAGILDLNPDLTLGTPVNRALGLRDTMIEVDLTPNRPDCASVLGIAREVGSFTHQSARLPIKEVTSFSGDSVDFKIIVENPELCPRYAARKISGVHIGPSPDWMQRQLLAAGMRPINNVVDITNFVMLELGQPLHAFDFNTIEGNTIVVRCPRDTETHFTTLDNVERVLESDMLMICNEHQPVAVAGVMGGLESEVTDTTVDVLLESACFNPVSIRKTARKLNIPSEASYRFERGVDPEITLIALERAVQLLEKYANGKGFPDALDVYPGKKDMLTLSLRPERVNNLLGIQLDHAEIIRLLESIEFEVSELDGVLNVQVPSFRVDIEREIDLVEEIARLVGFNEIPTTLPKIGMDSPKKDPMRVLRKEIADIMTSMGFYEAINYSFISEKFLDSLCLADNDPRRKTTDLLNPLSEDQGVMRPIMLPGLLENIRHNLNRQQTGVKLFEIGKTFSQQVQGELPKENYHLAGVLCGDRYPFAEQMYHSDTLADLFDLKGSVQQLLSVLRFSNESSPTHWQVLAQESFDARYCELATTLEIVVQNIQIGLLGSIRSDVLADFGIKQPVYFFDIDLNTLLTVNRLEKKFSSLPKYPAVKRDIALLVPADIPAGQLLAGINDLKEKMVESVCLFDVYKGQTIEKGYKSVAISVTYRAENKTLNDNAVDKIHKKIVDKLMSQFNARYREGSVV